MLAGGDDLIGIYRRANDGTWEEVLPDFAAWTIAFSPHDASVVFAGDPYGRGIMRSTDGGTSWQRAIEGFPAEQATAGVMSIDVSPHDSQLVYAAASSQSGVQVGLGRGLWRSTDLGAHWSLLAFEGQETSAVHVSRADANLMLVGFGGRTGGADAGGIARSIDAGLTWEPLRLAGVPIVNFAADATDPDRVYVATLGGGVFWSEDDGATWTQGAGQETNGWSWGVRQDPNTPTRLYSVIPFLGSTSVAVSTDRGATWSDTALTDASAISIGVGSDGVVYVGTYGGALMQSADGGQTWAAVDVGNMSHSYVYGTLSINPSEPAQLVAPAHYLGASGGVFVSDDRGNTWAAAAVPEVVEGLGNVLQLARDPGDADHLYAAAINEPADAAGLWESVDGGRQWTQKSMGGTSAISVAVDPSEPSVVWLGTPDGLHKSSDGGAAFAPPVLEGLWITSISFGPQNQIIVATGGYGWGGNAGTGFWSSDDGGASWAMLPFSAGRGAYNVVFDAQGVGYFAHDGGVSRSHDNGATATLVHERPTDLGTWIAIDPSDGSLYYTGYNYGGLEPGGVFRSRDGGDSWEALGDPDLTAEVWALTVDPGQRLYASTFGSGVWARLLPG